MMYGDNAENIPDGKAIRDLSDFYVMDQGPPPEEVQDA